MVMMNRLRICNLVLLLDMAILNSFNNCCVFSVHDVCGVVLAWCK